MNKKELLSHYNRLGFKLTHIPSGSKGPNHTGWNTTPTTYKRLLNGYEHFNVGLLHGLSNIICFDIDNVKAAKSIDGFMKLMNTGLCYSSGKKNRLKVLFRVKKKLLPYCRTWTLKSSTGIIIGQFRCMSSDSKSMQDVLPPSVHPSGSIYKWVNDISSVTDVPMLPKVFIDDLKSMGKMTKKLISRYNSKLIAPYVKAYNKWYASFSGQSSSVCTGDLESDVLSWGDYESVGMGRLKRIGSSGKLSIIITDSPSGGQIGQNFSDTIGFIDKRLGCTGNLLPLGPFDPYAFLVCSRFNGDERAARRYVCNEHSELSKLVDKETGINNVSIFESSTSGIEFDKKTGCPSLSLDVMMPEDSAFSLLVSSLMYHQIQVYNPNMAFWYALILIDYLAGGGYASFMTSTMSPLYCFTSGTSSDGKTKTIEAGETHLFAIGGGIEELGDTTLDKLRLKPEDLLTKKEQKMLETPDFTTNFSNKRQIDDAGSVEGIKDLIGKTLGHGCDLLYTHDEFGITSSGKGGVGSSRNNDMQGLIMSIKSIGRLKPYRYRLKAQNKENKTGVDTYCVHFNYFTSTTNESLRGVLSDSDIGKGFMQRFIGGPSITSCNSTRIEKYGSISPPGIKIENAVKKNLKLIVKKSSNVLGMDRCSGGIVVTCGKGVEELIAAKSIWIGEQTRAGKIDTLKILENILPVCRARAIIENPKNPVVTIDIFEWADKVVSSSVLFFKWLLGELKSKNINIEVTIEKKVLQWLDENRELILESSNNIISSASGASTVKDDFVGVSRRDMVNGSGIGSYGAAAYNPVLNAMVEAEIFNVKRVKTMAGRYKKLVFFY